MTPVYAGVFSVIRPSPDFSRLLPYRNCISAEGLTQTCTVPHHKHGAQIRAFHHPVPQHCLLGGPLVQVRGTGCDRDRVQVAPGYGTSEGIITVQHKGLYGAVLCVVRTMAGAGALCMHARWCGRGCCACMHDGVGGDAVRACMMTGAGVLCVHA